MTSKRYIDADGFIKNMSDIRESVMQKHKLEHGDATIDGYDADLLRAIGFARQLVSEYPTADVRPNVRGEWIDTESNFHVEKIYKCSECGHEAWGESECTDFCPNCGCQMVNNNADMRGEE